MTGVGLCLPQLGRHVTAEVLREFAQTAESLGYSSLWVQDHFMYPGELERGYGGIDGLPMPAAYESVLAPTETLAAVAAWTTKPAIGTSVLVAGHHWPVPLAQRLATLDLLSSGRLIVGLGVGWNAEEHTAAGTDIATRGRRMDDFVPAMLACWGQDPVQHDGPIFTIPAASIRPKPLQKPRPRIISGMWSPAGLERTARLFDGWNPAGLPVELVHGMAEEMNALRTHDQKPLEVFYRTFAQGPLDEKAEGDPIARMSADAEAASRAGFQEVIVEANFWSEMDSPSAWLDLPRACTPILEAAKNAG